MAISSAPGSPFYDPSWSYIYSQPDLMDWTSWTYGEDNPGAPWTKKLADLGYGGMDTRGNWGRSRYNRAQEGYGAAAQGELQKGSVLNWQDYLSKLDIDKMWNTLSPTEKGYNDAQFGGPPHWNRRS